MMQAPQRQMTYPKMDENRIDINLIAMLLWQSLLTGVAVSVSHMNWYLPSASAAEMGLQYGLVTFGFLCVAMVLFHVGGIRDSLAMRAEFSQEARFDKWQRGQERLQERRARKSQMGQMKYYQQQPMTGNGQTFGLPITQPSFQDDSPEAPNEEIPLIQV